MLPDPVLSDPVPLALAAVLVLAAPVGCRRSGCRLVSLEVGEPVPDGLEVDGLVLVGVDVGVVALASCSSPPGS